LNATLQTVPGTNGKELDATNDTPYPICRISL